MVLFRRHPDIVEMYEKLRDSTGSLFEWFRGQSSSCHSNPCIGTRCDVVQPQEANACCLRAGGFCECVARCPPNYEDFTVQQQVSVGACCVKAVGPKAIIKSTTSATKPVAPNVQYVVSSIHVVPRQVAAPTSNQTVPAPVVSTIRTLPPVESTLRSVPSTIQTVPAPVVSTTRSVASTVQTVPTPVISTTRSVASTVQTVPAPVVSTIQTIPPAVTSTIQTIPAPVVSTIQTIPAPVVSTIQTVPTPEKSTIQVVPIPEKSTSQVPVSTPVVGGSSAAAQVTITLPAPSAGESTLIITTTDQFTFSNSDPFPATVTVYATNAGGGFPSSSSLRTLTKSSSHSTGSATPIPDEGLTGSKNGSGGLSSKSKIAIGAAIPILFIVAVAAFFFIWNRRRKNKRDLGEVETGVPELDSSAGLPRYSAIPKTDPVKTGVHEVGWNPNGKEEYVAPPPNSTTEMEAAMARTALRAQQLAKNRSGASMMGGPPIFEMPYDDARSPTGTELAADERTSVYEAVGVDAGYAAHSQPSEVQYSPVYEADGYETGYPTNQNQNEIPGSPVSRRSELMAGSVISELPSRVSSPIKRKDVNSGPLVVPDELR